MVVFFGYIAAPKIVCLSDNLFSRVGLFPVETLRSGYVCMGGQDGVAMGVAMFS